MKKTLLCVSLSGFIDSNAGTIGKMRLLRLERIIRYFFKLFQIHFLLFLVLSNLEIVFAPRIKQIKLISTIFFICSYLQSIIIYFTLLGFIAAVVGILEHGLLIHIRFGNAFMYLI